jgi:O-acetyl-ADP-ribose deacetylase (regulator of RNase III)
MHWSIHVGDILDVPVDVLVCSANVHLNLSGGVGGAFALRYGPAMQEALHGYLADNGLRFVHRGDVIEMPSCGSPYRTVLHAVAVDAAYDTSPEVVAAILSKSLCRSAALGARSVALAAVGTGYGRLSLPGFAEGLRDVMDREYLPVERVVIGLRSRHDAEELEALAPALRAT